VAAFNMTDLAPLTVSADADTAARAYVLACAINTDDAAALLDALGLISGAFCPECAEIECDDECLLAAVRAPWGGPR